MIPVANIWYMLAYAFDAVDAAGMRDMASEDFDGPVDLLAAILARGLALQEKRGLARGYVGRTGELSTLRGRVDVAATARGSARTRRQLVCDYDEFEEDVFLNRAVKAACGVLLRSDLPEARRRELRRLLAPLGRVAEVDPHRIRWDEARLDRSTASYRLLLAVSRLVIEGALPDERGRGLRMEGLTEPQLHALYERFLLRYFQREHAERVSATAPHVEWALDDGRPGQMLPEMRTDVTLRGRGGGSLDGGGLGAATVHELIIDAKWYEHATQERWSKRTVHSANLYQIFTYVKNEEACLAATGAPHEVSGLLLYAKTDEEAQPAGDWLMSGNRICARTLDLDCDFAQVRAQLDAIVAEFFDQ